MFSRTLIISPHFDDETIGCGGLIADLSKNPKNKIAILVLANHKDTFNLNAKRVVDNEERAAECMRAMEALKGDGKADLKVWQVPYFLDGRLDSYDMKDIVTVIDKIISSFRPTAVLFPYSSHHQDHQVVYKASIAALRPTVDKNYIKLKAMYEYPYINSWSSNVNPNSKLYYRLSKEAVQKKERALLQYDSQLNRADEDILSVDSIMLLAKVRGREIGAPYAEVFYVMSVVVDEGGIV